MYLVNTSHKHTKNKCSNLSLRVMVDEVFSCENGHVEKFGIIFISPSVPTLFCQIWFFNPQILGRFNST